MSKAERSWTRLLALVAATLFLSLAGSRHAGEFLRPPLFQLFRVLLYLQEGLLASLLLALAGWLLQRLAAPRLLAFGLLSAYFTWLAWFVIWGMVRSLFAIDLTWLYVQTLFIEPETITAVGLGRPGFYALVALVLAAVAALSLDGARRVAGLGRSAARSLATTALLFVAVHLPLRLWMTWHIAHDQYAVLALDDSMPFSPRTERLVPGLLPARRELPSLLAPGRLEAWVAAQRHRPPLAVPRRLDIVWIVVESFRFDAIRPDVMPRLSAARDRFQVRLEDAHWSGGNTTKFGMFSMLMGVGGCHLQDFLKSGVHYPFLDLLAGDGYRLRMAKRSYGVFAKMRPFYPAGMIEAEVSGRSFDESDRAMVDAWLEDLRQRSAGVPSFDLLTFDATHWPYPHPGETAVFLPEAESLGSVYWARSPAEVERLHNRYRNACRFVDGEIGRVLDALSASGRRERTLVLVTGDHGEEFQEMGQLTHAAALDDWQARVPLWIHLPAGCPEPLVPGGASVHMDIVPTLLDALGFEADVLYTQGRSLLAPREPRPALLLAEQGYFFPYYHALVTGHYISRWRHGRDHFSLSGVLRRDGGPVRGEDWWQEAEALYPAAAEGYRILPDATRPPRRFR